LESNSKTVSATEDGTKRQNKNEWHVKLSFGVETRKLFSKYYTKVFYFMGHKYKQ